MIPVYRAAHALFGKNHEETRRWLTSPNPGLGGVAPWAYARQHGPKEVLRLIGRLEHGVFS